MAPEPNALIGTFYSLFCFGGNPEYTRKRKHFLEAKISIGSTKTCVKMLSFFSTGLLERDDIKNVDYFVVIDFEATCEERNPPGYPHEIIEFPAVLVKLQFIPYELRGRIFSQSRCELVPS